VARSPAPTSPRSSALLDEPGTRHQTLELAGGDNPVAAAAHSIS
jgi:hypothetical protein